MGYKKKLPSGLAEKQELQRREAVNKVLRASADIKTEGGRVTVAVLVKHTGLARSTFAKPHIRELLSKHGYASGNGAAGLHKRKNTKQAEVIEEKDRQIAELRATNSEFKKECALLREVRNCNKVQGKA